MHMHHDALETIDYTMKSWYRVDEDEKMQTGSGARVLTVLW